MAICDNEATNNIEPNINLAKTNDIEQIYNIEPNVEAKKNHLKNNNNLKRSNGQKSLPFNDDEGLLLLDVDVNNY